MTPLAHHSEPLLELKNVTVVRGGHVALKDVSFSIASGESVVILGANGSGKSTLIKLIHRELYPYGGQGTVKILGQSRWHVVELRSHLGIVSNDLAAHIDPALNCLDIVLTGYTGHLSIHWRDHVRAEWIEEAHAALTRVGAVEFADRAFGELSSGEARRVLVARALAHKPKALLLDEPTTSLDIKSRGEFLELIEQLQGEGVSMILVTHHFEEIQVFYRRVIALRRGEVLLMGTQAEVITSQKMSETFGASLLVRGAGPYTAELAPRELSVL